MIRLDVDKLFTIIVVWSRENEDEAVQKSANDSDDP